MLDNNLYLRVQRKRTLVIYIRPLTPTSCIYTFLSHLVKTPLIIHSKNIADATKATTFSAIACSVLYIYIGIHITCEIGQREKRDGAVCVYVLYICLSARAALSSFYNTTLEGI